MSMVRFADLADWVRKNPKVPCTHTVTLSVATVRGRTPTYSQCTDCGQVRRRYGLKPLIHNGGKRRKI